MSKVLLDTDALIEAYNKKNPKKNISNLAEASIAFGISYQNLYKYKTKGMPEAVRSFASFEKLTGKPLYKFIKE